MRWIVAVVCAVGCGDRAKDEPSEPCSDGDIALDVGWGKRSYTPLADGDVVTMVHGGQGGWHLEAAGEVRWSQRGIGILPRLVAVETGIPLTTNAIASFEAMGIYDDASCQGTFTSAEAYFSAAGPGEPLENICALEGTEATLTIEVTELLTGRGTSASAVVVLALDPEDEPRCP